MPKSLKISLLAVSAILLLTVFLGANLRGVQAAVASDDDGAYRQMRIYGEVLRHIQTDYVEDPKMATVTNGALRGLLETLDSNSSYLTPEEYKGYKAHTASKASVGINVAKRGYYATIISVVPGSSADKANLSDGDVIESIGNTSTRDLSVASINVLLDGPPNSTLPVAIIRPRRNKPEKLELTRTVLAPVPTAEVFYESNTIIYLKPSVIDKEHVQQVETRLKNMKGMGSKKILLDLRDVSTGDEADGLRLANFFIKSGTLATLEGQKVSKQTFTADSGKAIAASAPMVALVNRGTAGPAEIVAGALLDSKRADLVGEKTFGQGSELKTFELPDGSAVILSIAKYRTPSGKKLQDEGITPSVPVASDAEFGAAGNDDDDDEASATTATSATPTVNSSKPAVPVAKATASVDDQLNRALDLLKNKAA